MENATAILSTFSIASEDDTNASLSLEKCEEYCSWNEACWGCSFSCKQSCQWYAISACDNVLESKGLIERYVSRKPGLIMQLHVYKMTNKQNSDFEVTLYLFISFLCF